MVRYGPLYSRAVLRPLAEQLVQSAAFDGRPVCRVIGDDGGAVVAALGEVTRGRAVVEQIDAVSDAHAAMPADPAAGAHTDAWLFSLCTVGVDVHAAQLLSTALNWNIRALVWDRNRPPVHEQALVEACTTCAVDASPWRSTLADCDDFEPMPDGAPAAWDRESIHDVARFDSFDAYWRAMVTERLELIDRGAVAAGSLPAVRSAAQGAVRMYTAADGTLRIPITATLLSRTVNHRMSN
jgi:hypothetical protein